MILNQLLLIVFLCIMNTIEATIPAENIVHIVLLTFLFWDGYNISGKNVKGNPVLSQFAIHHTFPPSDIICVSAAGTFTHFPHLPVS